MLERCQAMLENPMDHLSPLSVEGGWYYSMGLTITEGKVLTSYV